NQSLQAAKETLLRSNEDLEQYDHIVRHNLQEPLRTVSSFASLLDMRYRGRLDKEADTFLDYIRRGTEGMRSLIEKLLFYAQVGQERENTWDHVEMEEVFAWAMDNLEQAISYCHGF